MKLHDTIARVERASAPSRAIDGDVVELFGMQPNGFKRAGGPQPDLFRDSTGAARVPTWLAPKLMSSMDEAAMMIPRGWSITSLSDESNLTRCRVILASKSGQKAVGYACNRAAAILAGALRAIASDRGSAEPSSQYFAADNLQAVVPEIQPVLA